MKELLLFLLLCHSSTPVKHTLKFFSTVSDGVTNLPETVAVALVNDIQAGRCDSNTNTVEPKQTWMKTCFDENPTHLKWYVGECFQHMPTSFKERIHSLKQYLNQSGGVHILQRMSGCEWDNETEDVVGFSQYGYDGEDFLSLDLKTLTWIALKPQAGDIELTWNADRNRLEQNEHFLTQVCPEWLKMYLKYGKNILLRTVRPSVSLLQKTPSFPVSCHATGFYPHRALLCWTKDGEELHKDMEQGEILPNNDGTFQMSVDLNVSSVKAEDWRRYECVFQLSGEKDNIVTKLDKAQIRTNKETPINTTALICGIVPLTIVLIAGIGVLVYKCKQDFPTTLPPIQ